MFEIPVALALFFSEPISQQEKLDWMKQELQEMLDIEREKRLYNRPFYPRFAEEEIDMGNILDAT